MNHLSRPLIALALLALVAPAGTAHAQPDAGAKSRGEYNFYGSSGGSALRSAGEHSSYYGQYLQSVPAQEINPEVAREAADTIGTYITKARRHFAWMRRQAVASKDTETIGALDSIDKHLTAAAKAHHEMYEASLKAKVDPVTAMKHSQVIDGSLAAAIAEHDKLMKRLAGDHAPAPKK